MLLERDQELAAIGEAVEAASGGGHGLLLIEGPAGIGKTALLAAARRLGRERGLLVLAARGSEVEAGFPFGVVRQLLEAHLGRAAAGERRVMLSGGAVDAGRLLGAQLGGADARVEEEPSSRFAALQSLYSFTANVASSKRVLLAIDEAHWSDAPSLRFLLYLARRLESLPVLVVLAARVEEPGSDARLFAQLRAEPDLGVIRPRALSKSAVAFVLERDLGVVPDGAFVTACHGATGGNPFLTRELVASLAVEGVLPRAEAAGRLADLAPEGVIRSVMLRLSGLPESAGALAEALAIFGGEADLPLAARLAGLDHDNAADAADALAEARLVEHDRPLRFVHPLVRAALYSRIPPGARGRRHARAARLLSGAGATPEAVAAHLLETEARGERAVVGGLRRAAARAAAHGGLEAAAAYLSRALAEPPPPDERAAVLRELGEAELWSGQPFAGAEHLAVALEVVDEPRTRVDIALLLRQCLLRTGQMSEAVAALDAVRRDMAGSDRELDRLLDAAAVGVGVLDVTLAPRLADRIEALQRRAAEKDCREPLTLVVAAATAAWAAGSAGEAAVLASRGAALRERVVPSARMPFEGYMLAALFAADELAGALRECDEFEDELRRGGVLPELLWGLLAFRSKLAYRCGALEEAETGARDSIETARLYGHEAYIALAYSSLVDCLVEKGELAEAEDVLRGAGLLSGHRPDWYFSMVVHSRARLRAAQGRREDALEDLFSLPERYGSDVLRAPTIWPWRSDAALILGVLGEDEEARRLAAEEIVLARGMGAHRALGVALRAAGVVARGDAALELLEEAVSVLRDSDAKLEYARALADLGGMLRRAGRRAEARKPLREALDAALACGAIALAAFARAELSASGARPRSGRAQGTAALTASEHRVAALAAEGLSNPEIAQRLFLTRRTVETHLTHAYGKLGIKSRTELPAVLAGEQR
jgi:DNA-binding CsgD family transcriptional regulator